MVRAREDVAREGEAAEDAFAAAGVGSRSTAAEPGRLSLRRRTPLSLRPCPYLLVPDGGFRFARVERDHRCTAARPPEPIVPERQRRLCLTGEHRGCPAYDAATSRRSLLLAEAGLSALALEARRSRPVVRTAALVLSDGHGWEPAEPASAVGGRPALALAPLAREPLADPRLAARKHAAVGGRAGESLPVGAVPAADEAVTAPIVVAGRDTASRAVMAGDRAAPSGSAAVRRLVDGSASEEAPRARGDGIGPTPVALSTSRVDSAPPGAAPELSPGAPRPARDRLQAAAPGPSPAATPSERDHALERASGRRTDAMGRERGPLERPFVEPRARVRARETLPLRVLATGGIAVVVVVAALAFLMARLPVTPAGTPTMPPATGAAAATAAGTASTSVPPPSPTASSHTPAPTSTGTAAPTERATSAPSASPAAPSTYRVRAGDTLIMIAARFGTTAEELQRLNGIADPRLLRIGQVLKLR